MTTAENPAPVAVNVSSRLNKQPHSHELRPLFAGIALLFLSTMLGNSQMTPVLFPVNSLFGGAAFNQPITITAVDPLITDGVTLWAGSYITLPASITNVVVGLYPDSYTMQVTGVTQPVRFAVIATNVTQNVAALVNLNPYYGPVPSGYPISGTNGAGQLIVVGTNSNGQVTSFFTPNGLSLTNVVATNLNNAGSANGQVLTATASGVAWAFGGGGSGASSNTFTGQLNTGQLNPPPGVGILTNGQDNVAHGAVGITNGSVYGALVVPAASSGGVSIQGANGLSIIGSGGILVNGSGNITANGGTITAGGGFISTSGNISAGYPGVINGDMSGGSNYPAAQLAGTLPLATLPSGTVTNWTVVTPLQFGAIGNGVANDTSAISNAVKAVNTLNLKVLDLAGQTYYVTSGFAFTVPQIEVRNGAITTPSNFLGAIFTRSTASSVGIPTSGAWFHHLTLGRQGTNPPDASVVGIQTGTFGTSYANDVKIDFCHFTNLWRDVTIVDTPQFDIEHNTMGYCWSNCVYVATPSVGAASGEGGDESVISYNDVNSQDNATGVPSMDAGIRNNLVIFQFDGYCIHVSINFNNGAGCKQVLKSSPTSQGCGFFLSGGEYEGLFATYSNLCPFEFWNSTVQWHSVNVSLDGAFGSSNYLASVGLYATNGSHLNFSKDLFTGDMGSGGNMDIWSAEGYLTPLDGCTFPFFLAGNGCKITVHTNFGDLGTVFTSGTPGTMPFAWNGATNVFLGAPFSGVTTVGSANALQVINQPGVGQYCYMANSPTFGAAPVAPGYSGYNINDRGGGQGFLGIEAGFSTRLKLFSTAALTVPDMDFSNGTNRAACVNQLTNQANVFAGDGSALVNLNASALASGTVSGLVLPGLAYTNSFDATNSAFKALVTATNAFDATNSAFNALRTATNSFAPSNIVVTAALIWTTNSLTNSVSISGNMLHISIGSTNGLGAPVGGTNGAPASWMLGLDANGNQTTNGIPSGNAVTNNSSAQSWSGPQVLTNLNNIISGNGSNITSLSVSALATNGVAVVATNNVYCKIPWFVNAAGVQVYLLGFTNGP